MKTLGGTRVASDGRYGWDTPVAKRYLLDVTGIEISDETTRKVGFTWTWFVAFDYLPDFSTEKVSYFTSTVSFRLFDDGWRLDEDTLTEALAQAKSGPLSPDLAPKFRTLLEDTHPLISRGARHALAAIGKEAFPQLIDALNDRSVVVRRLAAHAFAESFGNLAGEAETISAVKVALGDDDDEVRLFVAFALFRIGFEEEARPVLEKLIENPDTRELAQYMLDVMDGRRQ